MKTFRFLLSALAILALPILAQGASSLTLTGTYADKIQTANGDFFTYQTGSSTINATLPITGFDVSTLNSSTVFDVLIEDSSFFGAQLYLSDATDYIQGKRQATWVDADRATRLALTWTSNSLTLSGTAKLDAFALGNIFDGTEGKINKHPLSVTIQLGAYSISREVYVSGSSTTTSVIKGDTQFDLKNISLTGTADMVAPTVKILLPKPGSIITNGDPFTISAQAADGIGISEVQFCVTSEPQLTGNEQFAAMDLETNQYVTTMAPFAGTNFIFVIAIDNSGNSSAPAMRSIYYSKKRPLQVTTSGLGAIRGVSNGALLDVAKKYTVTATPQPGQVLSYWKAQGTYDTYYGYQKSFDFWMDEGMTLTAYFVPNPYPPLKGNYSGVFFDRQAGVNPTNAGAFALSITTNGAYSGNLRTLTGLLPFTGQLELDQNSTNNAYAMFTIKRPKIGDWHGQIQLNLGGSGQVTGTLARYLDPVDSSQDVTDAQFDGELLQATTRSANQGVYNLALPQSQSSVEGPVGISYGTATIDAKAGVKLVLHLADQIAVTTTSSAQGIDAALPIFAPLYANKGLIIGWVTITNGVIWGGDVNLTWQKTAGASKTFYTNGFNQPLTSEGALWLAHKPGTNLVEWTTGTLSVSAAGNTAYEANVSVLKDQLSVTPSGDLQSATASVNPATGALTGSFNAKGIKPINFSGIYIPGIGARGFFLNSDSSGSIELTGQPR